MRLRNIKGSEEIIGASPFVIKNPQEHKGKWSQVFNNNNPIHIEIGMGKGRFLMDMALLHPEINYIGIEKYSSVILRGIQKRETIQCENLYFICEDANILGDVFEKGEVKKLYLNFSDPWPKDRHAKRRLTSKEFLKTYEAYLDSNGSLEFKTDNKGLFEFSLEEVKIAGWDLVDYTFNLHQEERMVQGNVMTEYEEKFSKLGNPIQKLIARQII